MDAGATIQVSPVAMADAMSVEPIPVANAPKAPAVVGAFYREQELGLVLDPTLLLGEEATSWIEGEGR